MVGHEKLINDFRKLSDNNNLFHAYLFFGEPQTGKFLFALSFANYLENRKFEEPKTALRENLTLSLDGTVSEEADRETVGIDAVRSMQNFLYQKPIFSSRRTVIVRDAENLSSQAQHAVLKIIEEPPLQSLIILVVGNPEILFPTLNSRLQKIYFSRMETKQIADFLINKFNLSPAKAKSVASESFGRIGRAISLREEGREKGEKRKVDDVINNNQIDGFFEDLISDLAKEPVKNCDKLRQTLRCLTLMKQFNINKKLQLRNLLSRI